jgi:hypothetical protein
VIPPWTRAAWKDDWHRNDCDAHGVHLVRLPDRTLVRADRYAEELAAYEREHGADPDAPRSLYD